MNKFEKLDAINNILTSVVLIIILMYSLFWIYDLFLLDFTGFFIDIVMITISIFIYQIQLILLKKSAWFHLVPQNPNLYQRKDFKR